LIGGTGVLATFPLALDTAESAGLKQSAQIVHDAIDALTRSGQTSA
jgi:hypothetical protein